MAIYVIHSVSTFAFGVKRNRTFSLLTEGSKTPVAILVRVSTVKQETARQISELQTYADAKGYEVHRSMPGDNFRTG
jgi:hypothetical protein